MADILLIGYGNPLRKDDGIGWCIARELRDRTNEENLQIVTTHQLTPELAEDIRHYKVIIFVDAQEGGKPGTFSCTELIPALSPSSSFSHHVEPASLLSLSRELYHHVPKTYLIAIPGADFGYGETLTPQVEEVIPKILAEIQKIIQL